MRPRGRYAPSPTGSTHLGNAATALLAWLSVRSRGGDLVLRIEDLDRPRVVPGAAERMMADLRWLGLDWDEGPDRGGPHAPYAQSERAVRYDAAFEVLRRGRALYPCFCSRKDVLASASAPQAPGDEVFYPGTCRGLSEAEAAERIRAGHPHSWRLRVRAASLEPFDDLIRGRIEPDPEAIGDFVVRRADGVAAYQLAVVVDDIAMGITEVVRGGDLVTSTFRQIALYRVLGASPPRFGHGPLLIGEDGTRLSKRHRGVTLDELRSAGWSAARVTGWLACRLGLRRSEEPIDPRSLVAGFDFRDILLIP